MVGLFSRFSVRGSHRRTQSAIDDREVLPSVAEATRRVTLASASSAAPHGIEIALEFKPVERPSEPIDNDQPILCPLPEPSILNDGRIWKERVSSGGGQRRADTTVAREQSGAELETALARKPPRLPLNHVILPSISAPEHNILKLLEDCNASGI